MAQFISNYTSSVTAIPQVNDVLFFETFVKTQENVSNNLSCTTMQSSDELKCNIAMIFNLKKNLESLKSVLVQFNLKDEELYQQKQYSNDLKAQMEFLLDRMKNYKLHSSTQKKVVLVPHRVKKKKKKRNLQKLEYNQTKSFIKNKVPKKKPILKDDIQNLCRNNDIRLSEVISRKTDAQNFLNFLRDVAHLRKVKAANAKVEGQSYSSETNAVIENIIDRIKQQWTNLINDYNTEERNLKEMMKDDTPKNLFNSARLHYWERILFGDDISRTSYEDLNKNYKKYYALLRCMWDECIDTTEGVNLPLGWVIPQEASNPAWKEYCQELL